MQPSDLVFVVCQVLGCNQPEFGLGDIEQHVVTAITQDAHGFFRQVSERITQRFDIPVGDALDTNTALTVLGRRKWTNWGGNQTSDVESIVDLARCTLDDVRREVLDAKSSGKGVHVVGRGHSFSDVVQADQILLARLGKTPIWPQQLAVPVPAMYLSNDEDRLVEIAANATIDELNLALSQHKLAFNNLGGATVQTFAGATSTSTHGSGIELPPLCDAIVAVEYIDEHGQVRYLAPADAPFDAAAYYRATRAGNISIELNTDRFNAYICSFGTMGISMRFVVAVREAYLLRETRNVMPWTAICDRLGSGIQTQHRHVEFLLNPLADPNAPDSALLVTRDIACPGTPRNAEPCMRSVLLWFSGLPAVQYIVTAIINLFPKVLHTLLRQAITATALKDEYVDHSFLVYDLDLANNIRVISGEYAVANDASSVITFAAKLAQTAQKEFANGRYHAGPIAGRFVRQSRASMSMMHGRDVCMFEIAMMRGVQGITDILTMHEDSCISAAGRPHWGQLNILTGEPGWLEMAYSDFPKWLDQFSQMNTTGVFDNAFVARLGLRARLATHAITKAIPDFKKLDQFRLDGRSIPELLGGDPTNAVIRALCDALLADQEDIDSAAVADRSIQLLASLETDVQARLRFGCTMIERVLPPAGGHPVISWFSRLSRAERVALIKLVFESDGLFGELKLLRPLGGVIRLLVYFPLYTIPEGRNSVGYKDVSERPRFDGENTGRYTYPEPIEEAGP